jgi:hypothetical protein
MQLNHRGFAYYVPDEWWIEAGMGMFVPARRAYRGGAPDWPNLPVIELEIDDIEPVQRSLSDGVFNDSPNAGTARSRVVSILRGFREDVAITPVDVSRRQSDEGPQYKLIHGVHRLYCSLAAGFSHVPAVVVADVWGDPTSAPRG